MILDDVNALDDVEVDVDAFATISVYLALHTLLLAV